MTVIMCNVEYLPHQAHVLSSLPHEQFPIRLDFFYLGCWKDENLPEMLSSIEGKSAFLDGSYATRSNKLQVCSPSVFRIVLKTSHNITVALYF